MLLVGLCATLSVAAVAAGAEATGPKVIGLGAGRTGTQTLRTALELLGYNVFGDGHIVWDPVVRRAWHEQAWGNGDRLKEIILQGNYTATTGLDKTAEWVWATFGSASDAKAILTVRKAEDWHKSVWYHNFYEARWMTENNVAEGAWLSHCGRFPRGNVAGLLEPFLRIRACRFCAFWSFPTQKEECLRFFNQRNDRLMKTVPEEKLLVYNVREGWEPLCKFLGVPVPEVPFPRYDRAVQNDPHFWLWKCKFWLKVALDVVLHLGPLCCPVWCCCWRRRRQRRRHGNDKGE